VEGVRVDGLPLAGRTRSGRGHDGSQKLPIQEQALKLLKDGLSDKQVTAKVGTNPNRV
jgi:hypothetical protein